MVSFFSWIPCCANTNGDTQEALVDPRDKVTSSHGFAEPVLQPVHEAVPVLGTDSFATQDQKLAEDSVKSNSEPEENIEQRNEPLEVPGSTTGLEPQPIPQAGPAPVAKARTAPSQRPAAPRAADSTDKAADLPPPPTVSAPAEAAAAAASGATAGVAERVRSRSKDAADETRSNSRAGSEPERRTNSRGAPNAPAAKAKSAVKKGLKNQHATEASMSSELTETGDKEFSAGNYESAYDAYTSAVGLDANNARAWAGRGGVNIRKGKHQDALEDLNKALSLDPKHQYAIRDRGEAKLKLGDFDGAILDYNAKLADAPADGRALCGRGEANFLKGCPAAAVKDFGLAARLGYPGAAELLKKAQARQKG